MYTVTFDERPRWVKTFLNTIDGVEVGALTTTRVQEELRKMGITYTKPTKPQTEFGYDFVYVYTFESEDQYIEWMLKYS